MYKFFAPLFLFVLAGCAIPNRENPKEVLRRASIDQARILVDQMDVHYASGGNDESAISKAKYATANLLKDPDSARFRNVRIVSYLGGKIVCGDINGKNSYGGYVGYQRFIASTSKAVIESTGNKYSEIDNLANSGIESACSYP